jgi:hypothetical protein
MSAYHAEVLLFCFPEFELPFATVYRLGILAEYDHTAGGLVQPVNGVKSSTVVIAQDVPKILLFVGINRGSMYEETGGFVHGEVPLILEKQPNLPGAR